MAPAASPQARSDAAARARAQMDASLATPVPAPVPAPVVPVPASAPLPTAVPAAPVSAAASTALVVTDSEHWLELVGRCGLRGPAKLLAENAAFVAHGDGVLRLSLTPEQEHLKSASLVLQLGDAIGQLLGGSVQVRFEIGAGRGETASTRNLRERDARQTGAEAGFLADPAIQRLVQQHGAQVVPESIRPLGGH